MAVISATNAWAVGSYSNGTVNQARALIVHWNGSSWKQQHSPNPGSAFNTLTGVAATSPTNAWAVGDSCTNCGTDSESTGTLTLYWNGTAWKQQSSPSPGSFITYLDGVAATSATNAWAVGAYSTRTTGGSLIEHWDGTAWKQQPSPNPGAALGGVAATSATNAWAVGAYRKGHTLTLHCC